MHANVAYDERDVRAGGVLGFFFYLAIAVAVSLLACWWALRVIEARIARFDTPPPPVRQGLERQLPPEPRLQGVPGHPKDPQEDLRNQQAEDRKALEETGWVDEKSGIARIPIVEAMKILAEKGLPAVPNPPADGKKR